MIGNLRSSTKLPALILSCIVYDEKKLVNYFYDISENNSLRQEQLAMETQAFVCIAKRLE